MTNSEKGLVTNPEKTASFTGHRTRDIFTRKQIENGERNIMRKALVETIEDLISNHGIIEFVSGGAIEVDQEAFVAVQYLKERKYPQIRNILAIPYREQPTAWIEAVKKLENKIKYTNDEQILSQLNFEKEEMENTIKRYNKMLTLADEVIYVDELEKYRPRGMKDEELGKHSNQKLQIRNIYMLDSSSIVIAVYNGKPKGGTANCVNSAIKKKKRIIYLNPSKNFEKREHEYESPNK